ncbi:hypothetical protein HZC27_05480 [Candidatus Roizmanbacteria bacterium]|nr:hypothetical protein [Candidatus Roizmanbacteria bacterium]
MKRAYHHLNRHKGTYGKYIIILAMCFTILAYLLSGGKLFDIAPKKEKVPVTPVKHKDNGMIKISTKDNKRSYKVGDTVELIVTASSDKQPVIGYDVMLTYDGTKLQFKESESLDSSFNMFTFTKKGKVSLTGVKRVKPAVSTVMTDNPIGKLSLKATSIGPIKVSVDFTADSLKDSNLMNGKNKDVLGGVEGVELVVGK